MVIAVDTGNKQIKTVGRVFVSGYIESETPPFLSDSTLYYNERYYALSNQRTTYMRDKTEDESFFILTLFAIGAELERRNIHKPNDIIDIQLLIGLPPAHYSTLYNTFEEYFRRRTEDISFTYNGTPYCIYIDEVVSYPQGYAAAMPGFGAVVSLPKAIILDWGGWTFDYVLMNNGKVDLSVCDSLERGVIKLYNQVQARINAQLDILLSESDIDAIIRSEAHDFSKELVAFVQKTTQQFVTDTLGSLRERGIDLKSCHAVLVGGGSLLLREYIEASGKIVASTHVTDIHANAKGYEILYRASRKGR